MWVVRLMYIDNNGLVSYDFKFFPSRDLALDFAKSKRRSLNRHWFVEILQVSVASVECVV